MITPDTARMLAHYRAWSTRVWFDAVAALPPGEATKDRKSLFKNMVHTLNHLYVVDLIWQAHLEGREHGLTALNTADHPPLDELREKQEAVDRWYVDWADRATDAILAGAREVELIATGNIPASGERRWRRSKKGSTLPGRPSSSPCACWPRKGAPRKREASSGCRISGSL